jgi:hypothetical protein
MGHIHVAVADRHLALERDRIRTPRGPRRMGSMQIGSIVPHTCPECHGRLRENRSRPAPGPRRG